ncbi:MAG: DUF1214 domain-containing protein [Pseudomonadota bacterium]
MMKRGFFLFAAAIVGTFIGVASALLMSGLWSTKKPMEFGEINVNGWVSDFAVGSNEASPYVRARVARHGLLALAKSEAVYFVRGKDDDGARLSSTCIYRISGQDMPARWWSITLYNVADSKLPLNDDDALSVDETSVVRADGTASGAWEAIIAPEQPADASNWISSRGSDGFDLLLRLYVPETALLNEPTQALSPPTLERMSCQGDEP